MTKALIVACDAAFGIGKDGEIPWHFTEDMKHFAATTKGSTCIMGRITCESILKAHNNAKVLPNRESIVITSNESFEARDAIPVASLEEAIEKASRDNIFIIGGAGLYHDCLPLIDEAYLTLIPGIHDCDVEIPEVIRYILENFDCATSISGKSGLIFMKAVRKTPNKNK